MKKPTTVLLISLLAISMMLSGCVQESVKEEDTPTGEEDAGTTMEPADTTLTVDTTLPETGEETVEIEIDEDSIPYVEEDDTVEIGEMI